MSFFRQFAALALAVCMGLVLVGCESGKTTAPGQPTLDAMIITPGTVDVPISGTRALRVTGSFSDSSSMDLTSTSTFASSAPGVAIVSPAGVVTAVSRGTATITATHTQSGAKATATVTVPSATLVSMALAPSAFALAPGGTQQLTPVGTYNEGSTAPLAGVTFVSLPTAIATVDGATGLVTAVANGVATITATHTATLKTATSILTVATPPVGGGGGFSTITFDSASTTYTLRGFGGAEDSSVVGDPIGGVNKVAKVVKSATAELWAGVTMSTGANESVGRISFDAANTRMMVRVYSPAVGTVVRLKAEDAADPTHTVETEATTTVANTWETLIFDFANPATGTAALNPAFTYDKLSIFFGFGTTGAAAGGAKTYYFDDVAFIGGTGTGGGGGGGGGAGYSTLTFDSAALTYTLTGFGGAEDSTVVVDPSGGTNKVVRVVKSGAAEGWAGTTVSTGANQSVGIIPLDAANTRMTVRVYSPNVGIKVRLKLEDAADNTHTVETEATTTVANAWETLTFDFASQAAGTAALNPAWTYNKVSIFFNFGTTGAVAGAKTYYFDDVAFIGGTGGGGGGGGGSGFTPITFDSASLTYTLTGFGGADDSTVVTDPTGGTNKVAKVVKSAAAELWAGTTVSTGANQSVDRIPLDAANTRMTVRVYSPAVGVPVRLKVEDAADPTHTVETEATTTVANAWETLTFDFASQAAGTAALNPAFTYNKVSIFFNFGTTGAVTGARTYYFDDVTFIGGTSGGGGGGGGGGAASFTSLTFDSASLTYTLTGFGGADDSTVVTDPTGGTNKVAKVVKSATAEVWAGTTVSTGANNSIERMPFDASNTRVTVRVYSPNTGIPVRLKLEDAADPTHTVEAEVLTTVANTWETLTFDFATQVSGTAALNLAYTYNKASIFFNFGTTGASAGVKTYYFDDLTFIGGTGSGGGGGGGGGGAGTFATVTFDSSTLTYTLTGFGGAEDATLVNDPAGGINMVAKVVKSAAAELWAGTTVSTGANQSVGIMPFSATRKRMSVRVYSPTAGIPVRLKVEDAADVTHTCETEATTTTSGAWETLTFDFANQAPGTAALNVAYTFNKVSIFFNFGKTGAESGGAKTYYLDDIAFLP